MGKTCPSRPSLPAHGRETRVGKSAKGTKWRLLRIWTCKPIPGSGLDAHVRAMFARQRKVVFDGCTTHVLYLASGDLMHYSERVLTRYFILFWSAELDHKLQNPNPKTQNPNPKPQGSKFTPHTPHPTPHTPHPTPHTQHTQHTKPHTPNPKTHFQIPNPKPQTPNSKPQTPNPEPQA